MKKKKKKTLAFPNSTRSKSKKLSSRPDASGSKLKSSKSLSVSHAGSKYKWVPSPLSSDGKKKIKALKVKGPYKPNLKNACPRGKKFVKTGAKPMVWQGLDGRWRVQEGAIFLGYCHYNTSMSKKWMQRLLNDRPSSWPRASDKNLKWPDKEFEHVDEALVNLPNKLLNLDHVTIHRMREDTSNHFNPATTWQPYNSSNAYIVLYDGAMLHSEAPLRQVLAHELAHVAYARMPKQARADFMELAGWKKEKGKEVRTLGRKQLLKSDSMIGVHEDAANHIELYLFNKPLVKQVLGDRASVFDNWVKKNLGSDFKLKRKK